MMPLYPLHFTLGWWGVALGVATGGLLGLFFHRDDWLGGYNSWTRRMLRLGHISFFGLAFLNFMFAIDVREAGLTGTTTHFASLFFIGGTIAMPLVCFLCAWKKPLRHLFPIPVACITAALVCMLIHPA